MSKENKYKQVKKEYRRIKNKKIFDRLNIFLRFYRWRRSIKEQFMLDNNLAPDIKTVTENIALVIDNDVIEIIHCQPKMAAILLSEPQIINIPSGQIVKPGYKYINNKFMESEDKK